MSQPSKRGRPARVVETNIEVIKPIEIAEVLTLADHVELFKARFPDVWDELRLCPLQHGLEEMIERLSR